jgi:hypothetical protein
MHQLLPVVILNIKDENHPLVVKARNIIEDFHFLA